MADLPNRLWCEWDHAGNPRCTNALGQLQERQGSQDDTDLLHAAAQQPRQFVLVFRFDFDTQGWASHTPSMRQNILNWNWFLESFQAVKDLGLVCHRLVLFLWVAPDCSGLLVEDGAGAQHHLIAETIGHLLERPDGAGDGHGDLGGAHAAPINGFHGLDGAIGAGHAHDGDDADAGYERKNLLRRHHRYAIMRTRFPAAPLAVGQDALQGVKPAILRV